MTGRECDRCTNCGELGCVYPCQQPSFLRSGKSMNLEALLYLDWQQSTAGTRGISLESVRNYEQRSDRSSKRIDDGQSHSNKRPRQDQPASSPPAAATPASAASARSTGSSAQRCFTCNSSGHNARFCPSKSNDQHGRSDGSSHPQLRYRCGQAGHYASECTSGSAATRPRSDRTTSSGCQACGQSGHRSRDCPKQAPTGHADTNKRQHGNPRNDPDYIPRCYNCYEKHHGQCPLPLSEQFKTDRAAWREAAQGVQCVSCSGHQPGACPSAESRARPDQTCYRCRGTGHYSSEHSWPDFGRATSARPLTLRHNSGPQ